MFIYLITNLVNSKQYVGQTCKTVEWRWKRHREARGYSRSVLHQAIRKYGADSFRVETIATGCSFNCLNYVEQQAIKEYGTLVPAGYNLKIGGGNGLAHPLTKKKMSEARKRLPPASAETREKLSRALKGRVFSSEHRAKLSIAFKGNQRAKGVKKTDEEKARISAMNKGRKMSPEFCENQRQRMIGTKFMLGKIPWNKGRKITEAERAALLAGWVKRKQRKQLCGVKS